MRNPHHEQRLAEAAETGATYEPGKGPEPVKPDHDDYNQHYLDLHAEGGADGDPFAPGGRLADEIERRAAAKRQEDGR